MKTITNSGDFTGHRKGLSNSGVTSKRLKNPNSAFADHMPVILKSNTETRFKNF
jgi:hypothetical protein